MNSVMIQCPCCGTLLTVMSDGIYTYSVPDNPMLSINASLASQISQQNAIANNQIAQQNPYYGMSNLINTVRRMEENSDN